MGSFAQGPAMRPRPWPWRRYYARCIDHFIFTGLLVWLGVTLNLAGELSTIPAVSYSFLLSSLVPVIEFLCLWQFGNTPGKAILRLELRGIDGSLTPHQLFGRCFDVWVRGTALGIPFISTLTNFVAGQYMRDHGYASWDKQYGTKVVKYGAEDSDV